MGVLPMSYTISPFVFSFETRSHYVAKASLKFAILLRLPGSWDCRCAPPYLASNHSYQPKENKMSNEWPEDHRVSVPGWPQDWQGDAPRAQRGNQSSSVAGHPWAVWKEGGER